MSEPGKIPAEWDNTARGAFEVHEVQEQHRPHVLEQVRGPGAPCRRVLSEDRVVVGRAMTADVRVDSLGVSRHHLLITRRGTEFAAEDCGSSNGVYLNGVRIHSAVLRDGDRLQVGDVVFVYHQSQ